MFVFTFCEINVFTERMPECPQGLGSRKSVKSSLLELLLDHAISNVLDHATTGLGIARRYCGHLSARGHVASFVALFHTGQVVHQLHVL